MLQQPGALSDQSAGEPSGADKVMFVGWYVKIPLGVPIQKSKCGYSGNDASTV